MSRFAQICAYACARLARTDARVHAWVGAQIGDTRESAPWRVAAVGAGRVDLHDDGTFALLPQATAPDQRCGVAVCTIPVGSRTAIYDVLAVDPQRPEWSWSLMGDTPVLGFDHPAVDEALEQGAPIGICRDALSWLRCLVVDPELGEARAVLDGCPALVIRDLRSLEMDRLMRTPDLCLVGEDEEHAAELERMVDAWRAAQLPETRPRFMVADRKDERAA